MTHLRRLALGLLFASLAAPCGLANAKTLVVNPDPTDTSTPYRDIPPALTAATTGDTVFVMRGTYTSGLTLKAGVTLEGEETAATRLTGTINWASGATLQRFTVAGGGMTLTGATSGTIRNNIFQDSTGSALKITGDVSGSLGALVVTRNTFYKNGTGVEIIGSAATVSIDSNIFSNNTSTGITLGTGAAPGVQGNHFFPVTDTNPVVGLSPTQGDPLFLNTQSSPPDLHVTEGSPCETKGAYSSDFADPTPGPVEGVSAKAKDTQQVTVAWTGNRALGVSVDEYVVSFKRTSGDKPIAFPTPVTITVTAPAATDGGAYTTDVTVAPGPPTDVKVTPMDGGLHVSWTKDPLADGYNFSVREDAVATATTTDVGNVASHDATGLVNGTLYDITVSSYAKGARFFSVTAQTTKTLPGELTRPFVSRASDSSQLTLALVESDPSAEKQAVPEVLQGYPRLADKGGCFLDSFGPRRPAAGPATALAIVLLGAAWAPGRRRLRGLLWAGIALLAWPAVTEAQASWATSVSAGLFYPSDPDWSQHFGERYMPGGKVSLGYLLVPQLEAGVDVGFRADEGKVRTSPSTGEPLDTPVKQTISVLPVEAYLLLNLRWREDQWVVPYVAGGYSRLYYRSEVHNGAKASGHASGYDGRVGLKFLLNPFDPTSAQRVKDYVGVQRTYFLVEAQRSWVKDSGIDESKLGGTGYYGGVSLEF